MRNSKNALAASRFILSNEIASPLIRSEAQKKLTSHLETLLKEDVKAPNKKTEDILTYGHAILVSVVYENYESAISELDTLLGMRKDYPHFGERAGPFVLHAKSLAKAIKAKREVGRLPNISRSQQKELIDALSFHFKELRSCILNIEKIERHARREDLSSTRWFVVTFYVCLMLVFSTAFVQANVPEVIIAIYQLWRETMDYVFVSLSQWLWPST